MHPRTIATLRQLEEVAWFANVGMVDTHAAIVLSSWEDAVRYCSSVEWENLCLEAVNQLSARLIERSKERYCQWNDIIREIRAVVAPFVEAKTNDVVMKHGLPKAFVDTVRWDILHICMEAEYADVFPPAFYAGHGYWYTKGHFPCGWHGDFPENGKLIIY